MSAPILAPGADIHAISKESGVRVPTLDAWKKEAREAG
jgi:transposase-like protein